MANKLNSCSAKIIDIKSNHNYNAVTGKSVIKAIYEKNYKVYSKFSLTIIIEELAFNIT